MINEGVVSLEDLKKTLLNLKESKKERKTGLSEFWKKDAVTLLYEFSCIFLPPPCDG